MESIPEEPEINLHQQNNISQNPLENPEVAVEMNADEVEKVKILHGILSRESKIKTRRVSFPDGDKIISGYNEARNPWASSHCTTNDELIQEYLNSCQEWNVKPITKLLLQLKEINDFSVRTASLTLKGEKIDTKVVETLEAILRRVQFVIIDLEATSLNDDSAAALFDMIEYYESAVNVLIGFNKNLGTRGWQAAAHMMRKMSCLRLFDGHSVPLSNQAVPFVGRALRLSNTLVTLHLENSSLSGRPILLIVAALRMNVTLQELFLADNQLLISDALQLGNLLKFNTSIHLLDIRNNLIQDGGVTHLCNGLTSEQQISGNGGLQTLVLWNNQISHQSLGHLALMLKSSVSLLTLNLGQNYLGDEGATKIKEGLLQNRSILRLGLVGTKMTCEGAIALAEFLAESHRIIRLDLRNNNIKVAGLMALSLAAKINTSLFRLDIDRPLVKNTIKELAEKQESLMKDISIYTTRNKELATRKVMMMQNDRPIRYMDMTSSGTTNNNNSDVNNKNNNATTNTQQQQLCVVEDEVVDSPSNSPELLPMNSVSYHQVSPVMISSSEMEKRANLEAKMKSNEEETTQQQTNEEEEETTTQEPAQESTDITTTSAATSSGNEESIEVGAGDSTATTEVEDEIIEADEIASIQPTPTDDVTDHVTTEESTTTSSTTVTSPELSDDVTTTTHTNLVGSSEATITHFALSEFPH